MFQFVLRDGFEYCEWQVRESDRSNELAKAVGMIPNKHVLRDARRAIEASRTHTQRRGKRVQTKRLASRILAVDRRKRAVLKRIG